MRASELARRLVHSQLARLEQGRLIVQDAHGTRDFGDERASAELTCRLVVQDPRFYPAVLTGGSLGAAEAYIKGWWIAEDLTRALRVFVRNLATADRLEGGAARVKGALARVYHWLRRNSRRGSRDNIHAHYDLGNDFFALFLDPTLSYSCGIFETPDTTLEEASVAKLERVCAKLDLRPSDHLLEIGTGWGGLAIHAAREYGCRVTTTTISAEQHELASRRVREAGLEDRVTVLLSDYRDLQGQYDRLVSIEMIEAVGHDYLGTFFGKCGELLRPDGVMVLQAITMPDHRYDQYRHGVDFIQRYVFPGSCVPSITAMCQAAAAGSDLRLVHLEDFGTHYARTLRCWRERFFDHLSQVRALGHSEEFIRMWDYYLSYCEAGFAERYISDVHLVLARPLSRREHILTPVAELAAT